MNFKNDERAPLLFIAGGVDHVMPAAVNRSNFDWCNAHAGRGVVSTAERHQPA